MSISLLSKHRNELLAIGMLWLALFHSHVSFSFKSINFVLETCGYGGVDIFMFLSGFGLYYAYKKENKYLDFIKKRLIKILPYNIIICIIWKFVYDRGLAATILDALGLSILFRANLIGWYTSLMVILYLLTPLYMKLFNKAEKECTFSFILLILIICLLKGNGTFTYIWFRSAVYILGIYFGYLNDNGKNINWIILIILMIIGWILMYYTYHNFGSDIQHVLPLILITPGLCLLLAFILDKITILNKPLNYISKYTYQFYLIHVTLIDVMYANYDKLFISIPGFDWLFNLCGIIIAFVLAVIFVKVIESVKHIIINKKGA